MRFNDALFKGWTGLQALAMVGFLLAGCGSKPPADALTSSQTQETERLKAENQDLAQVQLENQEAQRLKKENQDLPKLRSQYQEAARLQKDNAQLRLQLAKISTNRASAVASAPAPASPEPRAALALGDKAGKGTETEKELAQEPGSLNEGDDIVIDPKYLKQLLPDFDWDKFDRKEPIGVRALLEKDGVQLTNVSQLKDFGLTNYVVRRAPPRPATPAPATP